MVKKKTTRVPKKMRTKGEILKNMAESAGVTKAQVKTMFEALNAMIKKDLGRNGPGGFTIPGLIKVRLVRKPATKARKGINPFTREEMIFKAKPARNVVKAAPLKALKTMVG